MLPTAIAASERRREVLNPDAAADSGFGSAR
jgi:hypothetical protein